MPEFPDSQRVIYQHNPLEDVICQLRFPPILRIEADVPAAFQDAIRGTYRHLRESRTAEIPLNLPPELSDLVGRALSNRVRYDFVTPDQLSHVTLTRDFLAVSTKRYERWEGFRANLVAPLDALEGIYGPANFTRIGLRYRDVICRSSLGLSGEPWRELLTTPIAGELGDPHMADNVVEAKKEVLISLGEAGNVRVRHGLASRPDVEESCYLIDSDFFLERETEMRDVLGVLDHFNAQAGRLFRWAIQDRLHEALGPVPIRS